MDQTALLKSARELDQGALTTIFDAYAPVVYQYCYRLCFDSIISDELVGMVFSRLLENLASDNPPIINLRISIFQITYEEMVDRLGSGPQAITVEKEIQKVIQSPSVRNHLQEEGPVIIKLVSGLNMNLNAVQRHVLLLRFLENFSLNETALVVGKSVGNVKVIQNRALAKISQFIGPRSKPAQLEFTSGVDS